MPTQTQNIFQIFYQHDYVAYVIMLSFILFFSGVLAPYSGWGLGIGVWGSLLRGLVATSFAFITVACEPAWTAAMWKICWLRPVSIIKDTSYFIITMDFTSLVETMRSEAKQKQSLQEYLQNTKLLTEKCLILRTYGSPNSAVPEKVIKEDLQIGLPLDKISGDGHKNGIN